MTDFDVVVIGGGAAGLSGALVLGRSRRRVLVVDAGRPRNLPAGHVHNYLGREGTPPAELVAIGRAELAPYDVEVAEDTVASVTGTSDAFVVTTASGRVVSARRILVASGLADELPEVPGLRERWGRDVLHCPYCHGWEVRDRALAILATTPMATHHALLFRQLSDDVVVVLADGVALPHHDRITLDALGVRVVLGTPREVVVDDDRLVGLRLADGSVLERDAVVVAAYGRADLAHLAPLGLEPSPVAMGEVELGRTLSVDELGATTVPGVYAAGNVTDLSATVIGSAAQANRVGALINAHLAAQDARTAVDAVFADRFERSSWEERYSGERVWSGRVNPQLETEAAGLTPGRALDIGCGEGGDAIWLAARGWQVTAVDFADAALARTQEHAAAAGVSLETRRVDVRAWDPAGEQWDLVSSQFMHQPDGGMVDVTRMLASAVAPGGTLLVVGHHPDDLATGLRHGHPDFLFTPEQLLPALDAADWEVEVCEVRGRTQRHPETGEEMAVRDSVVRARRRA